MDLILREVGGGATDYGQAWVDLRNQHWDCIDRRTTVLVTHQLRDAIHADQIVVFEQGRVVETGSHASLLAAAGTYANLWQQQERRLQARE